MLTDEDAPSGRELDAKIAEACGWIHQLNPQFSSREWNDYWVPPQGFGSQQFPPHYSSDLNAAVTLGAEATRLGFRSRYGQYLAAVLGWSEPVALADATAEQRATAFYRAYLAATVEAGAKDTAS